MLIPKSESKKVSNSSQCTVWEYDFPSKVLSFATAYINGRYPDKGKVVNRDCEEIYYVISGSGKIHSERGDFNINKGDVYYFLKGEKYWTEGDDLKVVLVNSPKWTIDQHKNVN